MDNELIIERPNIKKTFFSEIRPCSQAARHSTIQLHLMYLLNLTV